MKFSIEMETEAFNRHMANFIKNVEIDTTIALKKFAVDLLSRIINKTPVDTGRARAGWFTAMEKLGGVAVRLGKSGENQGEKEGSYKEQLTGDDKYIEIINGVPYVVFLEYGHSKQAPHGMVRLSMREMRGEDLPRTMSGAVKKAWNKR